MEDVTVEAILHALSDPIRAAIYADIVGSDCSQICSEYRRVNHKPIPKSTLSQHFKALRDAGLIRGERHGIEMRNTSRCAELEKRFPGLVQAIVRAHTMQSPMKTRTKKRATKPPRRKSASRKSASRVRITK
jgi:DNA-binding transcriptional ArsR family regulator